jgi:glycolate oxidase FAD binding subunit
MLVHSETLQSDLSAIVGPAHVSPQVEHTIDGVQPQLAVAPGSNDEVSAVLRLAGERGLAVVPCGGGSKLGWGNRPERADLLLSLRRMDQVLEHAWGDLVATAQAGCSVSALQSRLAEHGQRLALDPLWPDVATIGGILATNDSGALRLRFGALRDLVLGVTVALPDGTVARSGGKVVKNVAGYDLPKLMTGALGTLGVILDATFRLYPVPAETQTVTIVAPSMPSANAILARIRDSVMAPSAVQCRVGSGQNIRVDVRFEAIGAAITAQRAQLASMLGDGGPADEADGAEVWASREALWGAAETSVIAKLSLLPTDLADVTTTIERIAGRLRLEWALVAQAFGIATLRLSGANEQVLLAAISLLRAELKGRRGALVLLQCPAALKERLDVWGSESSAQPLMRRVKEHFDPHGMLNPGRYLGF